MKHIYFKIFSYVSSPVDIKQVQSAENFCTNVPMKFMGPIPQLPFNSTKAASALLV